MNDEKDDHKDETILALQELVNELTTKLINLRVSAGIKIKKLNAQIDNLKGENNVTKIR